VLSVLILGGSGEAFALAEALAGRPGLRVVTSLAGRTRERRTPAGEMRLGGFGGVDGLRDYLRNERIAALIDATHPFAAVMTRHATEAGLRASVPVLHVVRPAWLPEASDRWIEVDTLEQAARAIPVGASPTFLTVGRTELRPFAVRSEISFIARMIDPTEQDPGIGTLELVFARGPFRLADEEAFLAKRAIRCVVAKNSGGEGARAKLLAARRLNLPVVMVRRPEAPTGETVADVPAALAWLERRFGLLRPRWTAAESDQIQGDLAWR
jgi:precorrin-6A/cobalt-precorrin-6A reductase